jgi:tetratricopeptide (TPR) repeat protein
VLYILEDAHWADPTTRELVTLTLGSIGNARVLLLITHRPDFQPEWVRHPQVTALTLGRLSRGQGGAVARAAGGAALPNAVVARILERADGVPLYIEELTRSVVETDDPRSETAIPETLQASLLARLDRLGGEAKELAQIAAVIGREFAAALLSAVSGKPGDEVDRSLHRLVTSEIVLPSGPAQDGVHAFRHALIQDAAYQSLLLSRRRQYHGEIARVLQSRFPELAETEPDLVARHYTAAGLPQQAIPYWLRAGGRARARFTLLEGIAHLERGVQLARELPAGGERSRLLLDLLLALGDTSRASGGHLQEALAAFREAAELARIAGSPADFGRAAIGLDNAEADLGILDRESVSLLETALQLLGGEDSVERCRVLALLGRAAAHRGDLQRAAVLSTEAIALARRYSEPRALFDALMARLVTTSGRPCPAAQFADQRHALDELSECAKTSGDPYYAHLAGLWRGSGFLELGDHLAFEDTWKHLAALGERYQISNFGWGLQCLSALRTILHGDFAEAERQADRAFELGRNIDGDLASGVYGVQMFTIRREQGRLAEVAPLFRRFLDQNPGDTAWRPGLAVIAGDLGFDEAARKAFDDMAGAGFALPNDAKQGLTLSYLAEVCTRLKDAARAEQLYRTMLPYRDNMIHAPVATVCCGAAARYLGMLAGVIGDWTAAEEHFETALAMDERMQAWPWLAHTQHEFAAALLARGRACDRSRADALLAAATETAARLGMPALRKQIDLLQN